MKATKLVLLTLSLVAILFVGCKKSSKGGTTSGAEAAKAGAEAAANIDLYVMSQCPYGVKALDAMIPAVEKLGGAAALNIHYIGKAGADGAPTSMHGQSEVDGNIYQLCAEKVAKSLHYKYLTCMNKDWRNIPNNWESCAKEVGIDTAALKACKEGEGKDLLLASFKKSESAGAQGSPTIKVNNEPYKGGRRSDDFLRGICTAIGDKGAPQVCANIPKPPEVKVIALTDKRCKDCDPNPVFTSLKQVFPGLVTQILDWNDNPEAKEIAEKANVKLLPAVLFDESIDKDEEGSKQMARWLLPAGPYKSLRVKAEFDPTAEICDNQTDDTGNGKTDCDDETCKEALVCREEKKNRLDVFVMSQCPYGVLGLNAMKEILDAFGDEVEFGVHFIAEKTPEGFRALHGQPEVDENIRELCAIKHYAEKNKYMDYIWCRNQDIRSEDWKKCTGKNGIKAAVIEKCSTGKEGAALLEEDIKMAQSLKIGGSPTWLVNNRVTFNGIAAKDIQKNFCEKNSALKGCAKELSDAPAQAPQGSCGG